MKNDLYTPDILRQEAEQKKNLNKVGSIKIKPGHTLFEYDIAKGVFNVMPERKKSAVMGQSIGDTKIRSSVTIKEGCLYLSRLNKNNAIKELNVFLGERGLPLYQEPKKTK